MPEEWTAWILDSRGALRVGRAVCAAVAAGPFVAAAILVANFTRGRAIDGITLLLALAIPTLVAGQVWAIAILLARLNRAEGGPPRWHWPGRGIGWPDPRRLFEGLPWRLAALFAALFIVSWEIGSKAFPAITSGTPAPPSRHCRYRLTEGGTYTCVSRAKFVAADSGEQRLVAAAFAGFYTFQLAISAAELRRRRAATSLQVLA